MIAEALEWLRGAHKIPLVTTLAIAITTGLILFLPAPALVALGLHGIGATARLWISVAFLASTAWSALRLLERGATWLARERRRRQRLRGLDRCDEREWSRLECLAVQNCCELPEDPITIGLINRGLVSEIRRSRLVFHRPGDPLPGILCTLPCDVAEEVRRRLAADG